MPSLGLVFTLALLSLLTSPILSSAPPARPLLGNCTRPGIEIVESAFSTEFANGLQKQVIMYFYKVGCPFCAKFDPTWRCLVDAYAGNENVVFLKFPASESYHIANAYVVDTMPTVRYFPKGYRYRSTFLGLDYPSEEQLEFDKVSAFIHFALDKSEAQITYRVPSSNGLYVGKMPRGTDIVSTGDVVAEGTDSFNVEHVSTLYVTNTDDTLDNCFGQECVDHARDMETEYHDLMLKNQLYNNRWPLCAKYGTCLKLIEGSFDDTVCAPYVQGSTKRIGRENGKHNIFYNCTKVGVCRSSWKVRTAPTPLTLTWTHQCDDGASIGLQIGTDKTTMDVVSPTTGREQAAWVTGQSTSKVLPPATTTSFYVQGDGIFQATASIKVIHNDVEQLPAGTPNVLNVTVDGDVYRDTWGSLSGQNNLQGYSGTKRKYTNVALKKPNVKLSSMSIAPGESTYGNDGLFDLNLATGLNGKDPEPHYTIDLGMDVYNDYLIKSVRVWNTGDPSAQWVIMPFWVMLFSNEMNADGHTPLTVGELPRSLQDGLNMAVGTQKFVLPDNGQTMYEWVVGRNDMHAKYVRVQMVETRFLHLTEVEVFALPKNRQCPGGVIGANIEPECIKLSQRKPTEPVELKVKYRCHRPGSAQIRTEMTAYPSYNPTKPIQLEWTKECSKLNMDKLDIGLSTLSSRPVSAAPFGDPSAPVAKPSDGAKIMLNGAPRKGYEPWPNPYANGKALVFPFPPVPAYNSSVLREKVPKTLKHVPGHTHVYPLSIKLSEKGLKTSIRRKIKVWALTVVDTKDSKALPVSVASPNSNRSTYSELIDPHDVVAMPNIIVVKEVSKEDPALQEAAGATRRRRRRLLVEAGKAASGKKSLEADSLLRSGQQHHLLDTMRLIRRRAATDAAAQASRQSSTKSAAPATTPTDKTTTTTSAPTDIPTQEAIDDAIDNYGWLGGGNLVERETTITPYLDISGDDSLVANLVFGCVRTGDAVVTLNITHSPIWQPYRPTLVTMRKTCGGRRTGLHVYPSEKLLEDQDGNATTSDDPRRRPVPPISKDGTSTALLKDGQPARFNIPHHLPKKKSRQYKIVPGDEKTTTFYVRLPVREIDESLGNTTVVKTPCKYDGGSMCRQLPYTNTSLPSVTATCDPPICTSSYLGINLPGGVLTGSPTISGEVMGNTPATAEEEPWTVEGDVVPMKITYGCKSHQDVVVTITFSPSFYDPMSFSYHKRCQPSGWRIPSLILFSLILLVGTALMVLCTPCPCLKGDSLLKKMRHGKGQYMEM